MDQQQPLVADNNQEPDAYLCTRAEEDELNQRKESAQEEDISVFTFTRVGQHDAVHYDQTFRIRGAIEILNKDEAQIRFTKKSSVHKNMHTWPQKENRDILDSMFVYAWDFGVDATGGRTGTATTHGNTPTLEET